MIEERNGVLYYGGTDRPVQAPPELMERIRREKEVDMSNPGAKQFTQVHLTIDVWVDPETSDSSAWAVAENVDITARNAIESAMKEIEAPDHGIEVVVR